MERFYKQLYDAMQQDSEFGDADDNIENENTNEVPNDDLIYVIKSKIPANEIGLGCVLLESLKPRESQANKVVMPEHDPYGLACTMLLCPLSPKGNAKNVVETPKDDDKIDDIGDMFVDLPSPPIMDLDENGEVVGFPFDEDAFDIQSLLMDDPFPPIHPKGKGEIKIRDTPEGMMATRGDNASPCLVEVPLFIPMLHKL